MPLAKTTQPRNPFFVPRLFDVNDNRKTFLNRDVPDSTSFRNSNVAIVTSWA